MFASYIPTDRCEVTSRHRDHTRIYKYAYIYIYTITGVCREKKKDALLVEQVEFASAC